MIVALIGVAGSGKTALGERLAERLRFPFLDADQLHTPECAEQMRRGEPLTDAQRDAWFERVLESVATRDPLVLACSALRRGHRERLRAAGDVRMMLLDVPAPVLERRLRERHGHFFPARLLQSQLETMEPPLPEEGVIVIDAGGRAAEALDEIVRSLDAK
jgi:gluconokinase